MRFGIIDFIKSQYTKVPPVPQADLSGKTVIVTGANIGLGFEAAKHFARMNPAKLILACRNREKGDAAVNVIKQETGFQGVELWLLDLASFASVKFFSERFEKEGGRLDILVENAANAPPMGSVDFTDDGWEASVQINVLSTSLLALLLVPRMLETAQNEAHYLVLEAPMLREYGHKNDLKNTKSDAKRYQVTKLWNIFFVRALNDRLHERPVIVNAIHPGYSSSALGHNFMGIHLLLDKLMYIFLARTTEEGSRMPVWAAVGAEERKDELRGAYISLMEVHEPSDFVISKEGEKAQEKFWDNLIEELSQIEPKVTQVVKESLTPPVTNN
ncbi:hypothetical protein CPB84DRAFT_1746146 [Gymnopilus junonius]|uniref:NAD(P)-binding protein n=1 Tax=Gymnopilus junonius TaxID=109634 RepID=A0A9P5NNV8_GYMJU|nr:hypothetical protein CPB84DRAFT_1746146 [Gymnopilus junonius]